MVQLVSRWGLIGAMVDALRWAAGGLRCRLGGSRRDRVSSSGVTSDAGVEAGAVEVAADRSSSSSLGGSVMVSRWGHSPLTCPRAPIQAWSPPGRQESARPRGRRRTRGCFGRSSGGRCRGGQQDRLGRSAAKADRSGVISSTSPSAARARSKMDLYLGGGLFDGEVRVDPRRLGRRRSERRPIGGTEMRDVPAPDLVGLPLKPGGPGGPRRRAPRRRLGQYKAVSSQNAPHRRRRHPHDPLIGAAVGELAGTAIGGSPLLDEFQDRRSARASQRMQRNPAGRAILNSARGAQPAPPAPRPIIQTPNSEHAHLWGAPAESPHRPARGSDLGSRGDPRRKRTAHPNLLFPAATTTRWPAP